MQICLTGATGFLGRRLAATLAGEGHAIVALVRPQDDAGALDGCAARLVRGDVADPRAVAAAVAGAEVVFHLAGLVPAAGRTRADFFRVNAGGARTVAAAAVRAGVARLVHCSSAGVYGVPRPGGVDESTRPRPVNAYQASKLEGEHAVAAVVKHSGTCGVIARPTALYGRGERQTLSLFRAVASGRVRLIGDGSTPCQLTHVDDAAALLRACATAPGTPGEVALLLVGTNERTTVRGLIDTIAAACGVAPRIATLPRGLVAPLWRLERALARRLRPVPGRIDGLDFFLADRTVDVSRALLALRMAPRVRLADGIRDALAWARANHLL